jgi:hypothetical protein
MAVTPPPWPKTTAKPSLGMTTWLHPPVHININMNININININVNLNVNVNVNIIQKTES